MTVSTDRANDIRAVASLTPRTIWLNATHRYRLAAVCWPQPHLVAREMGATPLPRR